MIAFGSRDLAAARRREVRSPEGDVYFKSEWMESGDDPVLSPTVFLIEQPANSVAQVHFHRQNQYQLFVAGSGAIGHHPIAPLSVHYAGAYTGYGPLTAGPEGLQYLTLRPVFDTGAHYVPQDRGELRKGPKRSGQAGPLPIADRAALDALHEIRITSLLEPSAEGRAAGIVDVPAGASFAIPDEGQAQGCFAVVVAGAARYGTRDLELWESLFLSADEGDRILTAGEAGLSVALLHVPARHPAYA